MHHYTQLAPHLQARGIGSYLQNPDLLVVSSENPALPSSNCFWVTKRGEDWYIGTWLPSAYYVPPEQNIGLVCEKVFWSSRTAMYTLDAGLALELGLHR